ncbi:LysM domain-containing protein [Streptococcus pneumoniae]|nr:LysM domain-containing protein [Streptococcus pneumoniae]CZE08719.1 LysM domain-containing protein [Streptococcus pneumoniae]CZE28423.1 LysM domain-containing protein [Streptococcus pneumoniae]CZE33827.1 LysM domain-containing protein [Streptococcus pneumoniae]CZE36388.1 LysM domain-containing protein [Streptococcus pneumoniae]
MKKRMLLASTVALSFAPVLATQAEEVFGLHVVLSKSKTI